MSSKMISPGYTSCLTFYISHQEQQGSSSNQPPTKGPSQSPYRSSTEGPSRPRPSATTKEPSPQSSSSHAPSSTMAPSTKRTINGLEIETWPRTFTSSKGSSGMFYYSISISDQGIAKPPFGEANQADVYIHKITGQPKDMQAWFYNRRDKWEDISDIWQSHEHIVHPYNADRHLTRRNDDTPNWVLRSSSVSSISSKGGRGKEKE